ncbi:MAG: endopeptidase La [Deltaproteobacteria bacterium]|nr:endopeptidase La [Deltaproteobacteria bacterium]
MSLPSDQLPILPLRNMAVLPGSVVPVDVSRPKSMRLLAAIGLGRGRSIGVLAQRRQDIEDPIWDDLYAVGTMVRILRAVQSSNGGFRLIVQGTGRFEVAGHVQTEPYLVARVTLLPEQDAADVETAALLANLLEAAGQLASLGQSMPKEAVTKAQAASGPGAAADLLAANLPLSTEERQQVLETVGIRERVQLVLKLAVRQSEAQRIKNQISQMVEEEMGRNRREYYLRQQMRAIRDELGEGPEDDDLDELRRKLDEAGLPDEAHAAARKQLARLKLMQPGAPEATVARTYIDWLIELPWRATTEDRYDIPEARRILDEDHDGLEKVKRRILEHLAVRKLRPEARGPILCFVGPPGVGKTSLGRSIARTLGRRFVRASLGGVRDEAEIRGHRRTYVGSLPGRILQGMKKAGTINPLYLLDELDKLGVDFQGDPASALLEVLDPEQNHAFSDHYLEVPYDLSKVTFIGTANVLETIPPALRDRMEIIELPGYTSQEKRRIAQHFLVPKQRRDNGLAEEQLRLTDDAYDVLIGAYTREAGVRNLEREIAGLCRAVAVRITEGESDPRVVADAAFVEQVLGPPRFHRDIAERTATAGVATGLAWTPDGGDIIFVEATSMDGTAKLHLTGQLGNVMKESAQAALSFVRSRARDLGLRPDFLEKRDLHLHVPSGAIPKDGPSAGVTMVASLVSLLRGIPVRPGLAMTGEITLRGLVLPVGGIKEKVLAAHRAGIREVLVPQRNEKDLVEVPPEVREGLQVRLVGTIDEVLQVALGLKLAAHPGRGRPGRAASARGTSARSSPPTPPR